MESLVGKTDDYSPKDFGSWIDRLWKVHEEQPDDPARRKHLEGRLPYNTYHSVTVTSGPAPYTIQATKIEAEGQQNHTAWNQRQTIAHKSSRDSGRDGIQQV